MTTNEPAAPDLADLKQEIYLAIGTGDKSGAELIVIGRTIDAMNERGYLSQPPRLNSIHTERPTGRFFALYADGSGGCCFVEGGRNEYIDQESDKETYEGLINRDFAWWVALPDIYKLWIEREQT